VLLRHIMQTPHLWRTRVGVTWHARFEGDGFTPWSFRTAASKSACQD
jgi:hypothetical protein